MGCIYAILPEQFLKNKNVNRFVADEEGEIDKDYDCLLRTVAVHLHGLA